MSEFWSAAQLAVFARVVELNGLSAAARAYGVPKVADGTGPDGLGLPPGRLSITLRETGLT